MSGCSRERRERLLRLRRADEGAARGRCERARILHEERRAESESVAAKRDGVADDVRTRALGHVDLDRLRNAAEWRDSLSRRLETSDAAARDAGREVEGRRRDLEIAHGRVRAVESLSRRLEGEESAAVRSAEARERDDRRPPAAGDAEDP